jgi:hypothetical protein
VRGRFSRSSMPAAINIPKSIRTFDLPRVLLGTNQRQLSLCDLGDSAVRILFWTRMKL